MGFKWLDFKITNRCNNRCTYCGVKQDSPNTAEKVSTDRLSQSVKEAIDLGFTHFAFLGGEPSIRADFPQIVEPLQNGSLVENVMVISNMHLFNETMVRAIFNTNAKHAQLVASIDYLNEPNYKNQNIMQTLSYVNMIQGIAEEYKIRGKLNREVHVHSVISRENYRNIVQHIQYFYSQQIDVSMAIVEPFEIVSNNELCIQYNRFTKTEIQEIIDQLNTLDTMGLLNWANQTLREYLYKIQNGSIERYIECTAGSAHVIIESDGNVYPCLTEAYRKGLKFGNITTERFNDIFLKMQNFNCEAPFQQTCWDHFLWTKLEKIAEG